MAAPDVLNVYAAEPVATGGVYTAPLGTPKPSTLATALTTPWIALGFIGEDGVTETQDRSIDKKKSWGGATVKILQTDYTHSFKFVLLESTNAEVLKVVYGSTNVTVTGTDVEVVKNKKKLPKLCWCIDSIDSELNAHYRNYIPIGQIMTVGDVKMVHTDTIEYSVEMEAFPDSSGNHVYLMSDLGAGVVFQFKFEVPADDGTVENLVITLRDFALVPTSIWWEYGDDGERLLKEKLRWGFVDDEALTNFKRLPESKLPDLFSDWQESAKVTAPESGASSASSTDTVKPSRQTSSATDSD